MYTLAEIRALATIIKNETRRFFNTGARVDEIIQAIVDHINGIENEGLLIHNDLGGRDAQDCHGISSITSLQDILDKKIDYIRMGGESLDDICQTIYYGAKEGRYSVGLEDDFHGQNRLYLEVLDINLDNSIIDSYYVHKVYLTDGSSYSRTAHFVNGAFLEFTTDWIKNPIDAEVVHLAGDETLTGGKAFSKGAIFYGQVSSFPTGIGSYVAHYFSTAYNVCRSLAYTGVAYVDYALGAFISAKTKFSLVLKADGKAEFGNNVSVDGELSTTTFKLNGISYDANSFKGSYATETVSAPANGGTLTLKNATETVISTTLTNSNTFTIALPATTTGKVNESIVIFKVGSTLPSLTQPTGVIYRTETPDVKINQTWTFCYERVTYDSGSTYEIYVSATKNV